MSARLIVRPEAEDDLRHAFRWYEGQFRGLGEDFLSEVDAALHAILQNPAQFPLVHNGLRRALTRRFPYQIFYLLDGSVIIVFAIFHAKRNPSHWKDRT